MLPHLSCYFFCASTHSSPLTTLFFFNDTATTEIYTLSLHDALPILPDDLEDIRAQRAGEPWFPAAAEAQRSEEHTSELQSRPHLVCRLLLEKKKTTKGDVKDYP